MLNFSCRVWAGHKTRSTSIWETPRNQSEEESKTMSTKEGKGECLEFPYSEWVSDIARVAQMSLRSHWRRECRNSFIEKNDITRECDWQFALSVFERRSGDIDIRHAFRSYTLARDILLTSCECHVRRGLKTDMVRHRFYNYFYSEAKSPFTMFHLSSLILTWICAKEYLHQ